MYNITLDRYTGVCHTDCVITQQENIFMSNLTIKADIMWAQLEEKNDMSGKFQVDLCNLSDNAVEALETVGIEAGYKEDRGSFITCKSSRPIYAKGPDGESLKGIKVGNGSKCVGVVSPYSWTFKGKKGVSASLNQLVITGLEVYEADDAEAPNLDEAL